MPFTGNFMSVNTTIITHKPFTGHFMSVNTTIITHKPQAFASASNGL